MLLSKRGEVHGVIFVIDASNEKRFEEVTDQYNTLRKESALNGKPLLIICNKSDSPKFVSSDIMAMNLDLNSNPWCGPSHIIESSATLKTKASLEKGVRFLLDSVDEKYQEINQQITSHHEAKIQKRANQILLQKQRVQNAMKEEYSEPSSIIKSPGKMIKFVESPNAIFSFFCCDYDGFLCHCNEHRKDQRNCAVTILTTILRMKRSQGNQ